MVPLRLRLRNFLSYREACAPIEFAGVDLLCLCGPNGHGKSALLDAITWALWGKARGGSDDDLVHRGASEAEVELDFRVGAIVYRVIRKRRRPASATGIGRTELQFQVLAAEAWRSLTGQSTSDTERHIVAAIRLDYDTFRNSAFLAQGRADEFTTKAAGKRKEVLAGILGLDAYDRYERRARDRAKEFDTDARRLAAAIEQLERQLAGEPQAQREARELKAELEELARDLSSARALHSAALEAERAAAGLRQRRDALARDLEQARRRLARAEADAAQANETIARQQRVIERADQIRLDFDALQQARAAVADQTARLKVASELERVRAAAEQAIERERLEKEAERKRLEGEIERLTLLRGGLAAIAPEQAAVQAREADLALQAERLAKLREQKHSAELRAAELTAENNRHLADMKELKRKQAELAAGGANCPICGALLGEEGKAQISAQYEAEGKSLAKLHRENRAEAEKQTEEARRCGAEVATFERSLDSQRGALQRELARLAQEEQQAREAETSLPPLAQRHAEIEVVLAKGAYAPEARERLANALRKLAETAFDAALLERASAEAARLANAEREHAGLENAAAALSQAQSQLERAQGDCAEAQAEIAAKQHEQDEASDALRGYEGAGERLVQAEAQVRGLEQRERGARQALGAAEQQLDNCRGWRLDLVRIKEQQAVARQQKQIYDDLTTAFGKKGVQALIIDAALPEIENEANDLLARMTGGRMQLALTTQRQSKSGQNIETLDIAISDDLGTRPYELYSGGEAFRINLALRIALSKLLARRAGAPLPTLIVDEGFGTQDGDGRERLMEALDAVAADFECLIVVTHIEELKNRFERRIVVEKTAQGSIATLV